MKKIYPYFMVLAGTMCASGASLQVYQDSAIYQYEPVNDYIGISEGIEATCQGNPMALVQKTECPENERICKAYNGIIDDTLRLNELTANIKTLEQILSMHKINTLDASSIS